MFSVILTKWSVIEKNRYTYSPKKLHIMWFLFILLLNVIICPFWTLLLETRHFPFITKTTKYIFYSQNKTTQTHVTHRLPPSLWNSSLETTSAQESKYFWRVSTCLHRMSRKVSISASFSRNLYPFWARTKAEAKWSRVRQVSSSQESCSSNSNNNQKQVFSWHHRLCCTLKEDVDVEDKALAAEVRDNMEPWRLRLDSEPYPDSAWKFNSRNKQKKTG